ncbi:hypothetical protein NGB36_00865 [Streptomyces sp. RB6PN25]|uniref:Integral membrane protein n=1 Tax=Streptomyces humicola TaxID=2953240 RepID=A0ABT1PNF3_9ACTN|nr:hypothetical protein [Streptomyces humicola]MCQ4079202.1 hypothetical protein [Streptomyces humicola]
MGLMRGASAGFSILVVGGAIAPLAGDLPLIGRFWLTASALIAFLVAGLRAGGDGRMGPGVLAALGAYLLMLPIVWMTSRGWDVQQVSATAATAVVVGGGASLVSGRWSWMNGLRSDRESRSSHHREAA